MTRRHVAAAVKGFAWASLGAYLAVMGYGWFTFGRGRRR